MLMTSLLAAWTPAGRPAVAERDRCVRVEMRQRQGHRHEVVHQTDRQLGEARAQGPRIDAPGAVGQLDRPLDEGTRGRDPDAGATGEAAARGEISLECRFEARMATNWITLPGMDRAVAPRAGKSGVTAADIGDQPPVLHRTFSFDRRASSVRKPVCQ